jgi:group I intron endonuclease
MDRICGIYAIKCEANKKVYIGSSLNIKKRWDRHKDDLRSNLHHNKHLQRSWNKYGEKTFTFQLLEEVAPVDIYAREQFFIDKFKSFLRSKGFNLHAQAEGAFGYKLSATQRNKLRMSHLGHRHTEEHKKKIGEALRGEKSHWAILNQEQVSEIKRRLAEGERQATLGREFHVSRTAICDIAKGRTWKDKK